MPSYVIYKKNHEPAKAKSVAVTCVGQIDITKRLNYITDALNVLDYIFVRIIIAKRDGVIGKSISKHFGSTSGLFGG